MDSIIPYLSSQASSIGQQFHRLLSFYSTDGPAALDRHSKRITKHVLPMVLFLASASISLTVTQPVAVENSRLLFDAYMTFVNLTLSMGIGLSIYSIVAPEGSRAAWVLKRVMVVGLGCMAAAVVLRTCLVLPMRALTSVWLLFLLAGLVIFLSLLLAWNYRRNHGSAVVEDAHDAV